LWRHSATIQWATTARSNTLLTAKQPPHHHTWEAPGLQACLPTGNGGGDLAANTEKKSRSPSKAEPERIEQHEGGLNWGDERRRWRRTEAKPTDHHG
jgi:hypothetical protein